MAEWWDSYPDAPSEARTTLPQTAAPAAVKTGGVNWWDAYPDAAVSRQGVPGSGGRPVPRPNQQQPPPYLEGSIEGLREIPGDISRGARETITGAPERYAEGYGSVDRAAPGVAGTFNRVISAPLAGAYNVIAGSPAGQAAMDVGLSGYLPVGRRGLEHEPVRGMGRDIPVAESRAGLPEPPAAGRVAPLEVQQNVSGQELVDGRRTPSMIAYHGTNKNFEKFDPYMTRGGNPAEQGANFFSKTPDGANTYAIGEGANVRKVNIDTTNHKIYDPVELLNNPKTRDSFLDDLRTAFIKEATRNEYLSSRYATPDGKSYVEELWEQRKEYLLEQAASDGLVSFNPTTGALIARAKREGAESATIRNLMESNGADQVMLLNPERVTSFWKQKEEPETATPRGNRSTLARTKAVEYREARDAGIKQIEQAFEKKGLPRPGPEQNATLGAAARLLREEEFNDPWDAYEEAEKQVSAHNEYLRSIGAFEPGALGASVSPTRPPPVRITGETGSRPLISQQIGIQNRVAAQMNSRLEDTIKYEFAATPEQRKAYRNYIEKRSTDRSVPKILTAELLQSADLIKSMAADIRYELERLDPDAKQRFIIDYLSHMYKDTPRLRAMIGGGGKEGGPRLGGAAGHLKHRTIPTYEEAERLGLTPKYETIGETVQASNKMMLRFIAERDIENELRSQGFIHESASGERIPQGWVRIDSGRFANRPVFAPPKIAKDYNRFFKHPDAPWAATALEVNNALRGIKFFGPPYHLLTELVETATHDWASTLENIRDAQFWRATGSAAKGLTHTGLPANYWRGSRGFRDYLGHRTGPEAGQAPFRKMLETLRGEISPQDKQLVDILTQVNAPQARSSIDLFYGDISPFRWLGRRGWLKGFKNGVYATEVGNAGKAAKEFVRGIPGAPLSSAGTLVMAPFRGMAKITSEIMGPLFSELIPKAKFGASMQKLQDWIAANPDATHEQKLLSAAKIRQNSDNLFGEMVEDNQFMNRSVLLSAKLLFLSPSWNIGTARWAGGGIGGAAKAAATIPGNIAARVLGKGKPFATPSISKAATTWNPSIATTYGAILETVLAGSITTYLLTGRSPKDLRDVVAPPTGGVNERGEPDRIRPFADASFVADISKGLGYPGLGAAGYVPQDAGAGFGSAIHGKMNTIPAISIDLLTNKDYKNKPIMGENPIEQGVMYALQSALTPISFGGKGAFGVSDKSNIPIWARAIGMGEAGMQFTNPEGWKGLRAREGRPASEPRTTSQRKPRVRHEDAASP